MILLIQSGNDYEISSNAMLRKNLRTLISISHDRSNDIVIITISIKNIYSGNTKQQCFLYTTCNQLSGILRLHSTEYINNDHMLQ